MAVFWTWVKYKNTDSLNSLEIKDEIVVAVKNGGFSILELVIFIKNGHSVIEKSEFFGKYRRTTVSPPEFES